MSKKQVKLIEQFLGAVRAIEEVSPRLAQLGLESAALVEASKQAGQIDIALNNGLVTYGKLQAEFDRLIRNFEGATFELLGIRRLTGENQVDFFGRVLGLGYAGWCELAAKNGTPIEAQMPRKGGA